ncbi:hypothetical protein [Bradyrhizobium sp. SZCCHNRI3042]|uniref:hypothetical protein n=1 Tax=Bradyrhizobium sp. SZCCHNRI3042 TaxID=3057291 RepID=UPI002916AA3F|nr:hypothetical protein [Bradyrhizobium sp. SZCCHNRI3042]
MSLAELFEQFCILKFSVRNQLLANQLLTPDPPTVSALALRQLSCAAIQNIVFLQDEIDILVEKKALASRRAVSRDEFNLQPPRAGWLSVSVGGQSLPPQSGTTQLGVEKGAQLVFSQHELDGSVMVFLYPPEATSRTANFLFVLGRFLQPIDIRTDHIDRFIDKLILVQKVYGFNQHPTAFQQIRARYLRLLAGVPWDGESPLEYLGIGDRVRVLVQKSVVQGLVGAGALIVIAMFAYLCVVFGFDTLGSILSRK